jgi:hypothetical protein
MSLQKTMLLIPLAALAAYAVEIPSGTKVEIRLGQTISSAKARSGDNWDGTLASNLVVRNRTIAKKGAPVRGKVVEAQASGRLSGKAELALQLTSITVDGASVPVVTGSVTDTGGGHAKRNGALIGGGAAAGAIIGAVAGGGRGAAIGAGAGAAAGTGGAAATGKKDITFPVETVLTFVVR